MRITRSASAAASSAGDSADTTSTPSSTTPSVASLNPTSSVPSATYNATKKRSRSSFKDLGCQKKTRRTSVTGAAGPAFSETDTALSKAASLPANSISLHSERDGFYENPSDHQSHHGNHHHQQHKQPNAAPAKRRRSSQESQRGKSATDMPSSSSQGFGKSRTSVKEEAAIHTSEDADSSVHAGVTSEKEAYMGTPDSCSSVNNSSKSSPCVSFENSILDLLSGSCSTSVADAGSCCFVAEAPSKAVVLQPTTLTQSTTTSATASSKSIKPAKSAQTLPSSLFSTTTTSATATKNFVPTTALSSSTATDTAISIKPLQSSAPANISLQKPKPLASNHLADNPRIKEPADCKIEMTGVTDKSSSSAATTTTSSTQMCSTNKKPDIEIDSEEEAAATSNKSDLENYGEDDDEDEEDDAQDFDEEFIDYSDGIEDYDDNDFANELTVEASSSNNNNSPFSNKSTQNHSQASLDAYDEDDDYDDMMNNNDDDYEDDYNGINDPYTYDDFEDSTVARSKDTKVYEVQFSVLKPSDIDSSQSKEMDHVSSILSVPRDQAETLLWYSKWNPDNLIERYIDNPSKVLAAAGVGTDPNNSSVPISLAPYTPDTNVGPDFKCFICFDSGPSTPENPIASFGLECGHRTCLSCYRCYVRTKILDEGGAETIHCPQHKCKIIVNRTAVSTLIEKDDPLVFSKYLDFRLKHFVMSMDKLTFCPAANCNYIIECPTIKHVDPNRQVPTVRCKCGNAFCFKCQNPDHRPATCQITSVWLKRCRDDSETANWIKANTQECPKCHSTIEKNGGCNHMTCKQCRYEFCWVCMGSWIQHGNQFYNCSRYNESDAKEARDDQAKSRNELNRYLHYYNRFRNHQQSLALDSETFEKIQLKMREMQENQGMSWIQVQFLSQAFEVLRKSRQTLTWTYAFAFYLERSHQCEIFEDNQADLEQSTEQLSELFERPAADLVSSKVTLLDKSHYVDSRREVMLEHAAKGLMNGTWKYQENLLGSSGNNSK